jgi:dihydroneopterin aldolase/2-amino-4-hydroxy-6-hydroxymethyldihydropteridine diphosphokinase
MKARAYIAVGSNINPEENLHAALLSLARQEQIVAVSTVYQTEPEGRTGQPDFYNCVTEIETEKAPADLKYSVLRRIEAELGRKRTADKFASRTIDLDLVLYDDLMLQEDGLVLPDPDIASRPYLAAGMSELAPDLTLPGTASRIADLVTHVPIDKIKPLKDYTAQLRKDIAGKY